MSNVDYSKWDNIDVDDDEPARDGPSMDALGFDPRNPPALTVSTGEHAISLAKEGGDKKMESTLSRLVCQKCLEEGDVKRSRELIDIAVSLARQLADRDLEEDCDPLLGQIMQAEGNVEAAMQLYAKASIRFKNKGEMEGEATQRINIGKCYEMKALMREAGAEFKYALELAKRTQPANQALLAAANECVESNRQLSAQLAQMQQMQQAGAPDPVAPPPSADSFLSRAKEEGWGDDEDSDSDEDITGSSPGGGAITYQADMQALNTAMSDASCVVAELRKQGRVKEAEQLETLMLQDDASDDDSDSGSDNVDCDDLE